MIFQYILILIAYLIGSIPFSVIFGKLFKGIDVRRHGSGNPGGTNSLRFLGYKVGALIIFFDVLKGALIVALVRLEIFGDIDLLHPLIYGIAASFGHAFSPFIKFKGGKAVGTTFGAVLAYNFIYAIIAVVIFIVILKLSKYVSLGSTGVATFMVFVVLIFQDYDSLLYFIIFAALILYRHKTNFKNILNKVEPKVKWI